MSEYNLEELSKSSTTRPALEEVAVKLGLADASTYANKPAVLEAIKRVDAGEDAAAVNDELKIVDENTTNTTQTQNSDPSGASSVTQNDDDDEDDDDTTSDDENASDTPKQAKEPRYARNRNQGHPTKFDEQGRPLYRV